VYGPRWTKNGHVVESSEAEINLSWALKQKIHRARRKCLLKSHQTSSIHSGTFKNIATFGAQDETDNFMLEKENIKIKEHF